MDKFYSTRQAAQMLGIRPDTLNLAVWRGQVDEPMRGPSGQRLWTLASMERASWALLKKPLPPLAGEEGRAHDQ